MSIQNLDRKKYKVKEIIQSYLSLEKRGSNYWALCPFHDDSRASLSVSEDRNIFKCFACGVAGDAISFIMRHEQIGLQAALLKAHEILKLPTDELKFLKKIFPEEELKQNLFRFNEFILTFYSKSLYSSRGSNALNYLKNERKLSDEIINHFGLGYAPPALEVIETLNNLQKVSPEYKFLTQEFLLQTGQFQLIENKLTHSFRDRVVFPIYNSSGKVLSFSARSIKNSEDGPRYLHSKETVLYKKSECLYNLQALSKVKKNSFIYLFEGFFDVYTAYSLDPNGIYLALLGSQLSDESLTSLSQLPSRKLVLSLDNDDAGKDASLKLFKKALFYGFELYVLPLTIGKDLSESYQLDKNMTMPNPISIHDWIQFNWDKLFPGDDHENKLPTINQLVLSLLDSLFYIKSSNNQLFLKNLVTPKNAAIAIHQIFQLYEIIELTEKEKEILSNFKSKYMKVINLYLLSSNVIEHSLLMNQSENEKKAETLVTQFFNILTNLQNLKKSNSATIFLQTRKTAWESLFFIKYSNRLQLVLLPEEKEFLHEITESMNQLSNSLTPISSKSSIKHYTNEILNFFELYYLIIHKLIDKYEELIKRGPKLDLKKRVENLEEIERNRTELKEQSSKVFGEIIKWEKAHKN